MDRPILFSAPMVRALLAGTKTQTRRVVKPRDLAWMDEHQGLREPCNAERCPYGAPGDRLWVREAWRASSAHDALPPRDIPPGDAVEFGADPERILTGKLRPGMFMPRWASRITLEVTGVRVERLQDISEADALAEGCPVIAVTTPAESSFSAFGGPTAIAGGGAITAREHYHALWDSINGAGSWDANPWVWVVEFKRATLQG